MTPLVQSPDPRAVSLDALVGAVPLNVDLRRRAVRPGQHRLRQAAPPPARIRHGAPDTLKRRFLNTGGIIEHHQGQITIRLNRRTYSPILRQASLPETITVPWWGGRTLRYRYD